MRRDPPRARSRLAFANVFAIEAHRGSDYVVAIEERVWSGTPSRPCWWLGRDVAQRAAEHVYTEINEYQAGTWHARRVVIKAEVVRHRDRRAAGQSALRRDQHAADAAFPLAGLPRPPAW